MPAAVLLVAALASAAPVPNLPPDQEKLEARWRDLFRGDLVDRTRATLALTESRGAVEFLATKARPIKADAEQLKAWVKALNSDDEKVWKPALEQLRYYDPRIGLTPAKQIALVDTDAGRKRLYTFWNSGTRIAEELIPAFNLTLSLDPKDADGRRVLLQYDTADNETGKTTRWNTGWTVWEVGDIMPPGWKEAAVATRVLHIINSSASRAVLEEMATGHKKAFPTRLATVLLNKKLPGCGFHPTWEELLGHGDLDEPAEFAANVRALATTTDAAANLKALLPPIKTTKAVTLEWIKALESDDERVWKKAFDHLLYFHPQLAMTAEELVASATTDRGRAAVLAAMDWWGRVPDELTVLPDSTLTIKSSMLILKNREILEFDLLKPLESSPSPQWRRARLAIIVLERIGTVEAKEVLKQLADGHPDVLPTKEAKAALKRMEQK